MLSKYGRKVLAYGLFTERGIIYDNEKIINNEYGKPILKNFPNIHFNLSYSYNHIVCIISTKYLVGIDIERVRKPNLYAVKRVCDSEELKIILSHKKPHKEFFRHWTLKESYIKAIGMGISYPMKDINLEINSDLIVNSNKKTASFKLIEEIEGYIIGVCYLIV